MPKHVKRGGRDRKKTPLKIWHDEQDPKPGATDLATRFGCSRATIYGLLQGARTPSLDLALTIERLTGVPPSAWGK